MQQRGHLGADGGVGRVVDDIVHLVWVGGHVVQLRVAVLIFGVHVAGCLHAEEAGRRVAVVALQQHALGPGLLRLGQQGDEAAAVGHAPLDGGAGCQLDDGRGDVDIRHEPRLHPVRAAAGHANEQREVAAFAVGAVFVEPAVGPPREALIGQIDDHGVVQFARFLQLLHDGLHAVVDGHQFALAVGALGVPFGQLRLCQQRHAAHEEGFVADVGLVEVRPPRGDVDVEILIAGRRLGDVVGGGVGQIEEERRIGRGVVEEFQRDGRLVVHRLVVGDEHIPARRLVGRGIFPWEADEVFADEAGVVAGVVEPDGQRGQVVEIFAAAVGGDAVVVAILPGQECGARRAAFGVVGEGVGEVDPPAADVGQQVAHDGQAVHVLVVGHDDDEVERAVDFGGAGAPAHGDGQHQRAKRGRDGQQQ